LSLNARQYVPERIGPHVVGKTATMSGKRPAKTTSPPTAEKPATADKSAVREYSPTPKQAKRPPRRKHYGSGVYLQSAASGSASWLLRYQQRGKPHWMGIGSKDIFTLKEARARARKIQQQIYDGIDPLKARRDEQIRQELEAARAITFEDAAQQYYAQHEAKWSSHKHRQDYLATMRMYANPVIGKLPIADITTELVLRAVEPHWLTKNKVMTRTRARIEAILDWATVRGYRSGDNPARWSGHLSEVLPSGREIKKEEHHRALDYRRMPEFMAALANQQGIGARALHFLIESACRTSEVLGARWNEIDFDAKVMVIPPERMKARRPHRVPLTPRMIELLKSLPREGGDDGLVFVGAKADSQISKMMMPHLLKLTGFAGETTVHGFRSSFRVWAAERTNVPREVVEQCLAHITGSLVEQAYQRSDLLQERARLMGKWSDYISTPTPAQTGNVTPIRKRGAK
jgi:integrase